MRWSCEGGHVRVVEGRHVRWLCEGHHARMVM